MFEDIFGEDFSPEEGQEEVIDGQEGPEEGEPSNQTKTQEPKPTEPTEPILGKFKSVDDLVNSYRELERKLSQTSTERSNLNRQLQQMQQYLTYMAQQQQQQRLTQTPQQQQQQQQQMDPTEWLQKLYKGPQTIEQMIEAKLEQQGKLLGQALQQVLIPMQQYMVQQQQDQMYQKAYGQKQKEIDEMKKYPDFDSLRGTMITLYQQYPELSSMPMANVYAMAKSLQTQATQQKQVSQNAKKSAKMPATSSRTVEGKLTPDEQIKAMIFGSGDEEPGIFDD